MKARALILAVGGLLIAACSRSVPEGAVRIDAPRLLVSGAETPPEDSAGWLTRELPDFWGLGRRARSLSGWYRSSLSLDESPRRRWSVYLPLASPNAVVFVNDVWVGDGGRVEEPVARNLNRPLMLAIPEDVLRPGENRIDVRLVLTPTIPGLLLPYFAGPTESLRPVFEQRRLLVHTLPQACAFLALLLGVLIVAVYRGRDAFGASGWIGAGILAWALNDLEFFLHEPPVPGRWWDAFRSICIHWWPLLFAFGLHRIVGLKRRPLELWLVAGWLAFSALQVAVPPLLVFPVSIVWAVPTLGVCFYLFWMIVGGARTHRVPSAPWLLAAACVIGAFWIHDLAVLLGLGRPFAVSLANYSMPVMTLTVAGLFFARLGQALRESDELNRELERRVEEKRSELEENYDRLRIAERDRLIADERERIMREMHDGMGGQLVSTLAAVESGRFQADDVAAALRDSLDDLRLMVDSLDSHEEDLLSVLGLVRMRLEPRLSARGLRFEWQVEDVPRVRSLTPERVLHVLRIVQEAITNVVKHADASTISVRTGMEIGPDGQPGIFVLVSDDGRGIAEAHGQGRGLSNMRRRAEAIGGDLRVGGSSEGTEVRLWLPLSAPAADAATSRPGQGGSSPATRRA